MRRVFITRPCCRRQDAQVGEVKVECLHVTACELHASSIYNAPPLPAQSQGHEERGEREGCDTGRVEAEKGDLHAAITPRR